MRIFAQLNTGMKSSFSDILSGIQDQTRRKITAKLPSWEAIEGIEIPCSLALEQCSSEKAALYKSSLAEYKTVADLDGGLGVDVWAFAKNTQKVWYNELNTEIFDSARNNLKLLGLQNVVFSNMDASAFLDTLPEVDLLFLDPARRSNSGRKVFLLEDCSPDIMEILPRLWEHSRNIMLKLSPMADISLLERKLDGIREIHIVSLNGECKELLCILERGYIGGCRRIAIELSSGEKIDFGTRSDALAPLCSGLRAGDVLFEPLPVLQKAGMDAVICSRWGLRQLDRSTHLFIAGGEGDCSPETEFPKSMFRIFRVAEVHRMGKESMRELGRKYPDADVSARNVPLKSEELKKKIGIDGSGGAHIFGVSVLSERKLLVCIKEQ